jgi:hypothetical protein
MGSSSAVANETESSVIQRAQAALSHCNWEVGECAAIWTKRFARGRTDADFAVLVGLSPDQVYQRRRVWETFADVRASYTSLKWSHFYAAISWDDAAECLQWAEDIQATVAEMKAWRRAQRGEDLSQAADEEPYSLLLGETVAVKSPEENPTNGARRGESGRSGGEAPMVAGIARQSDDGEYAPFRDGAASVPSNEETRAATPREEPTAEQVIKRVTTAMEKASSMLTSDVLRQFPKLPEKVRQRFLRAVKDLQKRAHDLA